MANFKIEIGKYTEYRADKTLEQPDSKRRQEAWARTLTEAYNLDYTVADQTPLLPNNWYWDEYYCAAAGSYPKNTPVDGVSSGTWQASASGTYSTSLETDSDCYNGYALRILTATTPSACEIRQYQAGSDWFDNVNNSVGYTVIARLKVVSAGSAGGHFIFMRDGTYDEGIDYHESYIKLFRATTTYPMDTTDDYHEYKAVIKGTNIKVYLDGGISPIFDETLSNATPEKIISFGDPNASANYGGEVYYDFFTYYTGAEPTLMGTTDSFALNQSGGAHFPYLNGTALNLHSSDTGTDRIWFIQNQTGNKWQSISNSEGYIIYSSLKVIDAGSDLGQIVYWADGTYQCRVRWKSNSFVLESNWVAEASTTYAMDTTDDFHDYKIVVQGTTINIYIDDTLRITGTLNSSSGSKSITWGENFTGANQGGKAEWQYFKYKTAREAFAGVVACTSGSVPSEFCLDIDTVSGTAPDDFLYYAHASGTAPFHLNVNNVNGYTIEFQKKVIDAAAAGGQLVQFNDDVYSEYLKFYTSYIQLGNDGTTYPLNTTDDFHTYRITVKGATINVYENNALRITGVLATTSVTGSNKGLYWGDYLSGLGGESLWAYMKYRTDGAFPPTAKVDDGWVYSDFDIADKRRVIKNRIIRADKSIIPENDYDPAQVKVKGTIVGSCWNSFRESVRRLKRTLKAGTQKIFTDDERYIEGINANFGLKPDTTDFAKFNVKFQCRYPYWQQNWASYVSTSPVSGGTFYITNNGDVEVPCKVIITGAASGTIDDSIQLQNVTKDQLGKLVGVLQQTSELVIDKGFDAYSDYKVEVDEAASFGSYEGDLFTLAEGENAFVFTGGAVGTIEVYWREGFAL